LVKLRNSAGQCRAMTVAAAIAIKRLKFLAVSE